MEKSPLYLPPPHFLLHSFPKVFLPPLQRHLLQFCFAPHRNIMSHAKKLWKIPWRKLLFPKWWLSKITHPDLIFRSLSNPLLHRYVHLRNPTVSFGSVHWTVPWRWRHERHWTDLSHFQGCWIFGDCYGFPWMRLLCHYRGLDNVLYLEPAL